MDTEQQREKHESADDGEQATVVEYEQYSGDSHVPQQAVQQQKQQQEEGHDGQQEEFIEETPKGRKVRASYKSVFLIF